MRTKFSNRIIDFDVKSNAKYDVATDITDDKINTMKCIYFVIPSVVKSLVMYDFVLNPKNPPSPAVVGKDESIMPDIYDRDRVVGIIETIIYKRIFCIGWWMLFGLKKYFPTMNVSNTNVNDAIPKKQRNMLAMVFPILPHKFVCGNVLDVLSDCVAELYESMESSK